MVLIVADRSWLRYRWGIWLGWALQVVVLAPDFLVPAHVSSSALVFAAIWIYASINGGTARPTRTPRIHRRAEQSERSSHATEETLVLVKPDGVARKPHRRDPRAASRRRATQLVDIRLVQPDRELLAQHYAEHEGKPFYEPLVEFMESRPSSPCASRATA